jgi:hypothetical protein
VSGGTGGTGGAGASGGTGATGGSGGATGSGGASGSAGADPCDQDGDGVRRLSCQGTDCDDGNRDVHPDQQDWFATPRADQSFDYDCDDRDEQEFPEPVVCNLLGLGGCNVAERFLGRAPACGQPGSWGTCRPGTLSCVESPTNPGKIMRCH